ncbi:MAG: VOC family protein [Chloroflexi bacterium]|nr:MAG: VOC family protein [Chloroflexota bacterium]
MAKITSLLFVLPVRDLEQAVRFYSDAFDLQEVYRADNIVFVGIPGTDVSFGILRDPASAGNGPQNVGLHIDHAADRDDVISGIQRAGGKIVERGEHAPGVPFARMADPDGNELEI